jgi:hypothetical protein
VSGEFREPVVLLILIRDRIGLYCGIVELDRQVYLPANYYVVVHYMDSAGKGRSKGCGYPWNSSDLGLLWTFSRFGRFRRPTEDRESLSEDVNADGCTDNQINDEDTRKPNDQTREDDREIRY